MVKIDVLRWEDNQLTCYQENRNKLILDLHHVMSCLKDQYEGQGWKNLCPYTAAVNAVDDFDLVYVDGGLIGFTVGQPWFVSGGDCISEEFVYDVPVDTVVKVLKDIGTRAGCKRLLLGTRAVPRGKHAALARLYEGQGLAVSTIELTMELP